jgi:D-sedoheptulose 7-phosphate isomerase
MIDELYMRHPVLGVCDNDIVETVGLLTRTFVVGGKLLTAGNGGSAADAQHIVGELMKGFALPRRLTETDEQKFANAPNRQVLMSELQKTLPAISLVGETALMTAFANDKAPEFAFAQQVYGLGRPGDVFFGISTSGNSLNILYASQTAKAVGMSVVGLAGENGGKLRELCDVCITVPETETYKIQELHLPVYHTMCLALENEFFGG